MNRLETTFVSSTPSMLRMTVVGVLLVVGVPACGSPDASTPADGPDPIPLPTYEPRPSDGLLETRELQEIVDLQTARNGSALQERLEDADPRVRARAALALASVQDADARPALERFLADEVADVRADAAFALGQIELPDGGRAVVDALTSEEAARPRSRLMETIGKRGDAEAVAALLGMETEAGEARIRMLALARAGLRDVEPRGLVGTLLEGLTHPDGAVREAAAYYFGRSTNVDTWRPAAARVREALDGYDPDDPAAMHLIGAVARLGDIEDRSRLVHWLETAEDWRIRAEATGMLATPAWLEVSGVPQALLGALEDPSPHVRHTAAGGLALLARNGTDVGIRIEGLLDGPPEEWPVQARLLPALAAGGEGERVFDWTRRMAEYHPVATVRGVEVLVGLSGTRITDLFFELAQHDEPLVRGAAVRALGQRWTRRGEDADEVRRHFELFRELLVDEEALPAARAAEALAHPALRPSGSAAALESAFEMRREEGDANVLVPILEAMGPGSLTLLQEIAASGSPALRAAAVASVTRITGSPPPGVDAPEESTGAGELQELDWEALAELGPEPRVKIETERGELVIRLLPEEAPLSVQAFVREVQRGAHEGVQFHRVVPNFVIQGGDYAMGDGTGRPGYRIRSEFTQLPIGRGVLAMASAGKDTEGSQFFITHSAQPHLEGSYTAFGWLESGAAALDVIREGDRIVSTVILESGSGS